jgi:hypothetical protein
VGPLLVLRLGARLLVLVPSSQRKHYKLDIVFYFILSSVSPTTSRTPTVTPTFSPTVTSDAPADTPTFSPTATSSSSSFSSSISTCEDDRDFQFKGDATKTCRDWAAINPTNRCELVDTTTTDGKTVADFCPVTCGCGRTCICSFTEEPTVLPTALFPTTFLPTIEEAAIEAEAEIDFKEAKEVEEFEEAEEFEKVEKVEAAEEVEAADEAEEVEVEVEKTKPQQQNSTPVLRHLHSTTMERDI